MDHAAHQGYYRWSRLRVVRHALDLEVSAPVVKKLGKPGFLASAQERVLPIGEPVVATGAAVHEAVRVHQLRRNNPDDAARWPSDCQAGYERGVLAEVMDTNA